MRKGERPSGAPPFLFLPASVVHISGMYFAKQCNKPHCSREAHASDLHDEFEHIAFFTTPEAFEDALLV